ncbi:ROK family protein [Streptomyces cocklensis]|uniref:ROK family transcriptional regulator n=1 Tax=Actinacidiphila cocklensis TaxID=887465 RepID=A0A9W4GPT2_9ACTN|nr:ROK family protein [Actinacidiphila cocklensis]MDD1062543.1 ROK family protein [Actinacidiphila cocklensis]CAG6391904.1 ROK family transcriptional regulator [Actinacidiphila cocklensis]
MSQDTPSPVATLPVHGLRAADSARRRTSASAVLRSVLEHGPVARSTVARLTGLSAASVTDYCAHFMQLGLIREAPGPLRSNSVGRPHIPVDLDDARLLVGGVHVAVPYTTVALLDLRGRVVEERRLSHDGTEPGRLLARAADGLGALLAAQAPGTTPLSVGVATGGWVDRDSGTVVAHDLLGWRDVAVRDALARHTGLPVHVDSHSRALANGERLFGHARARQSVLHLFVGNVVDAAFAINDQVHYGPRSQAGAIAHLPVPGGTQRCHCGRTGCLQTEVSELTLCRQARDAGVIADRDPMLVLQAARDGDPAAVRLLVERARLVGRAVGLLLDLLNPDAVVVVELGVIHRPDCLAALREEAAAYTSTVVDVAEAVIPTSFPATVLATAGGSVALDVLYRDPLGASAALASPDRVRG